MERRGFRVDFLSADDDRVVLRAAGEIDLCSSFSFREQLTRAADGAAARLILDLSAVRFIDSAGLGVLAAAARRLFLEGRELVLVCPEKRIRRVLSTSGLDRLVPVYAGMQEALGGPVAGPSAVSQPVVPG